MQDLPEFKPMKESTVQTYVRTLFGANMVKLITFADHHYRIIFKASQFVLHEGAQAPSKSQWSGLKKRMKRHNRSVFVFKESGMIACPELAQAEGESNCYYIDFGFFAH